MNLESVCDAIEARLATITGLRVSDGQATGTPPFAVLYWPEEVRFDETYGRGTDSITMPLAVAVGRPTDRTARSRLSDFVDGSGTSSIKAIIESGTYTAFDSIRVASVEFVMLTEKGIDYAAALFSLEIYG